MKAASEFDLCGFLEASGAGSPGVVLNDRLMTEASLGVISQLGSIASLGNVGNLLALQQQEGSSPGPAIKTEHSYSLSSQRPELSQSPLSGKG